MTLHLLWCMLALYSLSPKTCFPYPSYGSVCYSQACNDNCSRHCDPFLPSVCVGSVGTVTVLNDCITQQEQQVAPIQVVCVLVEGCLMAAWQSSSSHGERQEVISWISKRILEINEDDAQALVDKDPDHPSFYDQMCSKLTCCCSSVA